MKLRNLFKKKDSKKENSLEDIEDLLRLSEESREPTKVMMRNNILNFEKDRDTQIIDS